MIDVGNMYFVCDECGICEQLEWRLQVARELGKALQFDHCSCDKVGTEFWDGGYCEDAFAEKPSEKNGVGHKTGRAYRRKMRGKTFKKYRDLDSHGRYPGPHIHKHYVKNSKSSANKMFFKRISNKKVRHSKDAILNKGNGYRKAFDYWRAIT